MARSRNIKPGFYKNEDLAECSVWARLIFPGLWMLADREGRLEDRPKRIKAELLPFDNADMDGLLTELQRHGFIVRYQNESGSFIQIAKFKEHQTPHYSEKPSAIMPPEFQESKPHEESNTPGTLQEHSENDPGIKRGAQPPSSLNPDSPNPDSRIMNPDSPNALPDGSVRDRKRRAPSRKTALPPDFEISDRVRAWAEEHGHGDLQAHLEAFRLKAQAKGYEYADWDAAFMEAVRNNWARIGEPQRVVPLRQESTYEHNVRAAEEWLRNGNG